MSKKISRRNRRIRNLLLVISMMMVVAMASVGVTVAWLTAETDAVVNTFTASDINIELKETKSENPDDGDGEEDTNSYKMVPGNMIDKNPTITVKADSEASWVFVQLTKSTTPAFDSYLTYEMASGWTQLETDADGNDVSASLIFWRKQDATTADVDITVLKDNQLTVRNTVTKAMMDAIDESSEAKPTLTVQAFACQQANVENAADAWKAIPKQ